MVFCSYSRITRTRGPSVLRAIITPWSFGINAYLTCTSERESFGGRGGTSLVTPGNTNWTRGVFGSWAQLHTRAKLRYQHVISSGTIERISVAQVAVGSWERAVQSKFPSFQSNVGRGCDGIVTQNRLCTHFTVDSEYHGTVVLELRAFHSTFHRKSVIIVGFGFPPFSRNVYSWYLIYYHIKARGGRRA